MAMPSNGNAIENYTPPVPARVADDDDDEKSGYCGYSGNINTFILFGLLLSALYLTGRRFMGTNK